MSATADFSSPKEADPYLAELTFKWLVEVGPALLANSRKRDLTIYEQKMLNAVKGACVCHRTNNPREYSSNGENCDICGRQM